MENSWKDFFPVVVMLAWNKAEREWFRKWALKNNG